MHLDSVNSSARATYSPPFSTPMGGMIKRILNVYNDPEISALFKRTYSVDYPGAVPIELVLCQLHWIIHTRYDVKDGDTKETVSELFVKALELSKHTCLDEPTHFSSLSTNIGCLVGKAQDLFQSGYFEEGFQFLALLNNNFCSKSQNFNSVVDAFVAELKKSMTAKELFSPRAFEIHIKIIRALILAERIEEAEIELSDFNTAMLGLKKSLARNPASKSNPHLVLYDSVATVFMLDLTISKQRKSTQNIEESDHLNALNKAVIDLINQHRAKSKVELDEMTAIICKYGTLDTIKTWFLLLQIEINLSSDQSMQEALLANFEVSMEVLLKSKEFQDVLGVLDTVLQVKEFKILTETQATLIKVRLVSITTKVMLNQFKQYLPEEVEVLICAFMSFRINALFILLAQKGIKLNAKVKSLDDPNRFYKHTEMLDMLINSTFWHDLAISLGSIFSDFISSNDSKPQSELDILFAQIKAVLADINTITSLPEGIKGDLTKSFKCSNPEIILRRIIDLIKTTPLDELQKLLITPLQEKIFVEGVSVDNDEDAINVTPEDSLSVTPKDFITEESDLVTKTEGVATAKTDDPLNVIIQRTLTHPSVHLLEAVAHLIDIGLYPSIVKNNSLSHPSLQDNLHVTSLNNLIKRSEAVHAYSAFKSPGKLFMLGGVSGAELLKLYHDDIKPLLGYISQLYDQMSGIVDFHALLLSPLVQMEIAKILYRDKNLQNSTPRILNSVRTLLSGLFTQNKQITDDQSQSNIDPSVIKKDAYLEFLKKLTITPNTIHIFDSKTENEQQVPVVSEQLAQMVISDDYLFGSYLAEMMHHEINATGKSIPNYAPTILQGKIRRLESARWKKAPTETIARAMALMICNTAPGKYFEDHRERLIACAKYLQSDLMHIDFKALTMENIKHKGHFTITLPAFEALIQGDEPLTENSLWLHSEQKIVQDEEIIGKIKTLLKEQDPNESASYISLGPKACTMKEGHSTFLQDLIQKHTSNPSLATRKTTPNALQRYKDNLDLAYDAFDKKYQELKKAFDDLPEMISSNKENLQKVCEKLTMALKELKQLNLNLTTIIAEQVATIKGQHK